MPNRNCIMVSLIADRPAFALSHLACAFMLPGFYLYAYMGVKHFISIGEYSISISLHVAAYCLLALAIFSKIKHRVTIKSVLSIWILVCISTIVVVAENNADG
jgi:hypothetical protein